MAKKPSESDVRRKQAEAMAAHIAELASEGEESDGPPTPKMLKMVEAISLQDEDEYGDGSLEYLARPKSGLVNLLGITMVGTKTTDAGIEALVQPGSDLGKLFEIQLNSDKGITDRTLIALARPDSGLKKLRTLFIEGQFTEAGWRAFAAPGGGLGKLEQIWTDSLDDAGARGLARAEGGLAKLAELPGGSKLGDAGLAVLISPSSGLRLKYVMAQGKGITNAGLRALGKPGAISPKLERLTVAEKLLGKDGVAAIRQAYPKLEVDAAG
jgi:hypothetical protein